MNTFGQKLWLRVIQKKKSSYAKPFSLLHKIASNYKFKNDLFWGMKGFQINFVSVCTLSHFYPYSISTGDCWIRGLMCV